MHVATTLDMFLDVSCIVVSIYWIWVNNNSAALVYVFIEPTYPTSDVTAFAASAVYILYILQITSELKEIVCYSKCPIGLLFHALSHATIKIFIVNVL